MSLIVSSGMILDRKEVRMDYKKVGQNIKEFRIEKGLTQQALAKNIGKSESSIRKYDKGLVEIPNTVIEAIAKELDIETFDLTFSPDEKRIHYDRIRVAMGLPLTTIGLPGHYSEEEIEKIKDYAKYIEWTRMNSH